MIAHVLESAAASTVTHIFVSTHRADLLGDLDDPVARSLGGRLTIVPAADNLADSVLAVAGVAEYPLLITTADHCLLTPATIAEIEAEAMRSEEHTSELQSLMRIPYAVFRLKKKQDGIYTHQHISHHVLIRLHHNET